MKRKLLVVLTTVVAMLCLCLGVAGCYVIGSGSGDAGNQQCDDQHGGSGSEQTHSHTFNKRVAEEKYLKSEATCTAKAVYYYSCQCGEKGTETFEIGEPKAHTFNQQVEEEKYLKSKATCTAKSVYYISCECGEKGTETFESGEVNEHTEVPIGTAKVPTCTEKGLTAGKKCSVCNTVIEEQAEISANGHSFTAKTVESKYLKTEADCTHKAVYFKSCKVCGEKGAETFESGEALGHAFNKQVAESKFLKSEATCSTKAVYYTSCECGEKGTDTYEYGQPNNHTFQSGKCTVCGSREPTVGLEYKLNEDEISYSVYEGSSTANRIVIADIYNGLPVTNIGKKAFLCSELTSITIPDSVTSISEEAFRGCSKLTSIIIPKSVTSIDMNAFCHCSGLTSITLSDSVKVIGQDAFLYCSKLTIISYTGGIVGWCGISGLSYLRSSSQTLYIDGKGLTGELVIPDGVTSIGDSAFRYCTSLTSITIPDSVTSIGPGAFADCSRLTSINIPNGVTCIGKITFSGCSRLTSITIPDSVTSISSEAFWGCSGLTSITIPKNVTSIGSHVFYGCTSLKSITIPDSVTYIGDYAFDSCTSLTGITIGNSVTRIGQWAFSGCSKLTSVTFKNTSGWKVSTLYYMTNSISISNSSLANHSTAATYLKSIYCDYYWKRG